MLRIAKLPSFHFVICLGIAFCANATAEESQESRTEQAEAASSAESNLGVENQHWAFRRPARPSVPLCDNESWPAGEIDRFILRKLEQENLNPTRAADRYSLLRRVTFDLTGLPPTPLEIESFVADDSPVAFQKVVERMLASTHFGERWGRHWLDLTGYADTMGVGRTIPARHAWRYRDYVIKAFNDDKPYDRFLTEQLAGDSLPYEHPALKAEQVTATGFLAIGPWELVNGDKVQLRMDVVDLQIDRVGRTLLGLTLGCSRCHDHKFDPIPQTDYYGLAGIFMSTTTLRGRLANVVSGVNLVPLKETAGQLRRRAAEYERYEAELTDLKGQRDDASSQQDEIDSRVKALKKETSPAGDNQQVARVESGDGSAARDELVSEIAKLEKQLESVAQQIGQLNQQITILEYNRPRTLMAMAVEDYPEPEDCRINLRGNARQLGDVVPRGFLSAAAKSKPQIIAGTSGRLELATWIANADNPLTARVFVNRVWHHLFGAGLVRSVDNLGVRGEQPTHPELLDYLAVRFVEQGWSTKALISQMVLSRTYRMGSDYHQAAYDVDPNNRWRWRMNRRRLEAESIRDAILSISGKLNLTPGGPSLPLDIAGNVQFGAPDAIKDSAKMRDRDLFRRTVFQPVKRKQPFDVLDILTTFDFPDPDEETGTRNIATVPAQALYLMNSPFIQQQAKATAQRLIAERDDDALRVDLLYLLALGRHATETDVQRGKMFIENCQRTLNSQKESADANEIEAWTLFCQSVLVSNEFLFRQ